jgi:hypothetical protein
MERFEAVSDCGSRTYPAAGIPACRRAAMLATLSMLVDYLGVIMGRPWEADESASFVQRIGKSAAELGATAGRDGCPDIWELDNGDVAVIGRDLTPAYLHRLPESVTIAADERVVIIPRSMLIAAKADIPDA